MEDRSILLNKEERAIKKKEEKDPVMRERMKM